MPIPTKYLLSQKWVSMEQIDIREDAQNVRPLFLIIFLTILIVIVNKLDAFVTVINLSLKLSNLSFHLA